MSKQVSIWFMLTIAAVLVLTKAASAARAPVDIAQLIKDCRTLVRIDREMARGSTDLEGFAELKRRIAPLKKYIPHCKLAIKKVESANARSSKNSASTRTPSKRRVTPVEPEEEIPNPFNKPNGSSCSQNAECGTIGALCVSHQCVDNHSAQARCTDNNDCSSGLRCTNGSCVW